MSSNVGFFRSARHRLFPFDCCYCDKARCVKHLSGNFVEINSRVQPLVVSVGLVATETMFYTPPPRHTSFTYYDLVCYLKARAMKMTRQLSTFKYIPCNE